MGAIIVPLIALVVVIISAGSLRRKGRIGNRTEQALIGMMVVILLVTIVLAWRAGSLRGR